MAARSSEVVRRTIEDEISNGTLRPGDQLEEQRLGARFAISRTPVREALLQLAAAGLVQLVPRKGAVVCSLQPETAIGMVETVAALEAEAAGLAARRLTPAEKAEIEAAHAEAKTCVDRLDCEGYIGANTRFHELIYRAARNDYLASQIRATRQRMRVYYKSSLTLPARLLPSWEGHNAVVFALLNGAEQSARESMRAHMLDGGRVYADLVAALGRRQAATT